MIASNPAVSPVTGWPIGFWWAELSHAHEVFREAGHEVTVASPDGGDLEADAWSDPDHETGYAAHDEISRAFKADPEWMALLAGTPSLGDLDPADFDAVFVVGGQGPMVTMVDDERVQRFLAAFFEADKPTAAVCHGTAVLLRTQLSSGELLVRDHRWTGFANSEEEYSEKAAGQRIQPFRIEDEARRIDGTEFVVAGPLEEHAIRDGWLITGQQQNSSATAAREVVAALG